MVPIALVVAALLAIVIIMLPLRLGVVFRFAHGQARLAVIGSVADKLRWQIAVPLHTARLSKSGLKTKAEIKAPGIKKQMTTTVSPEEVSEERRISESSMHRILSVVDIIQVHLLGKDPSDQKNRSLGSPLINMMVGPFMAFSGHLCRMEFSWHTTIATKDPVLTALSSGMLWGVKSGVVALLTQKFHMVAPPSIKVEADFKSGDMCTDLRCIFHLSVGQIIGRVLRDAAQRWQWKGAGIYGR